jgi:NitT/TauT family transport system ATP-binding protein
MIAGFIPPTGGAIDVGGRPVRGPSAERGVVFQGDASLYPWLTARENVEFGPKVLGVPRDERRQIAERFIRLVGLSAHMNVMPNQLSGGMKQRIQIARVLANDPSILLMDEPFGALDAQTREIMQDELERLWDVSRKTVVFVTHDIEEAVLLGDRVAVMTAGPAATIKVVRNIPLPRPRRSLTSNVAELRDKLRQDLREETFKAMEQHL